MIVLSKFQGAKTHHWQEMAETKHTQCPNDNKHKFK